MPSIEGLKLKDPKDFRYLGKGEVSIVDLHDITVGAAHYGSDTRLPGMKYAVIARPPVTGGKLVSFDAAAAMKVSGVEKVMEVKGWPWPSKFQPLGGVAVIARNTGAAIKGRDALKIVWDDGANAKYEFAGLSGRTRGSRAQARAGRAQGGRRRRRPEERRQGDRRRILPAASGPCQHGAAGRGRQRQGRQGRNLGAGAKPRRHARGCREDARHSGEQRHRQRHAARRRFRPQVEMRLRAGSGVAVEGRSAPRSRCNGRGRTTFATTSFTPCRWNGSRPVSTRAAR